MEPFWLSQARIEPLETATDRAHGKRFSHGFPTNVERLGLQAKHPALVANPSYFRAIGTGEPTAIKSEPIEQQPQNKPLQMMRAKRTVSVEGCLLPGGFRMPGRTIIQAGEEVSATHPACRSNKELFEKVKP
jgi:hypothetical protein